MCLQMEVKQYTTYSSETLPFLPANETLKGIKQYQARTGQTSYYIDALNFSFHIIRFCTALVCNSEPHTKC